MFWSLVMILGGVFFLLSVLLQDRRRRQYFKDVSQSSVSQLVGDVGQAIDLRTLEETSWLQQGKSRVISSYYQLGSQPALKVIAIIILGLVVSIYVNQTYFRVHQVAFSIGINLIFMLLGMNWLQAREKQHFEEAFPDALTMLASAVSAGEGLMQSFIFVGRTLDGPVGKEFKKMGDRLQMGESTNAVFSKSCQRFPYPSFHFFVITMRANIDRGGQIKEVVAKLNRVMFSARAIEKKKYALTSEARVSAKIVGALPFFFLFLLQYISPDNFEFVMFHPDGRPVLYYVMISECIGMGLIWLLMKGVR
ncbi:type II secretion system F family protein [Vibrio coralliilyticus]|uniref:Pilus assembly protein TadB n=1 Tax=Vibrio coralliilyticus TaxID=190893 RepID=A0AAP6ZPJ4_9VIBR|nr:type II secretion system F family protein [Vibrio coralliilyticus]NOJ24261.1 pilus assembly protein TadB [Vibrio coralliilyticus]